MKKLLALLGFPRKTPKPPEYTAKRHGGDCIITVTDGHEVTRYRGSSTVWRNADTGERASSPLERKLSQVNQLLIWEEEDRRNGK